MALVSYDPDRDRVMVLPDPQDGLPGAMVRESGTWRRGTFDAYDLRDNFERVTDAEKASMFVREARAAALSL